jgi:hypothetical protein
MIGAVRLWPKSLQGRRWIWLTVLTLFLFSPFAVRSVVDDTPKICSFKNLTGIGCPGCGLTRSVCALSEGRVGAAIEFHAFGPLVVLLGLTAWIYYLVAVIRKREPFQIKPLHLTRLWLILAVSLLGYWILRLSLGVVP